MTKLERVRHYRETLEIGLAEAARMVEREDLLAEIARADSVRELRDVLKTLVGKYIR